MSGPTKHGFIDALRRGFLGREAAIEAGYSPKTAAQIASRLLRDPDVVAAFDGKPPRGRSSNSGNPRGRPPLSEETKLGRRAEKFAGMDEMLGLTHTEDPKEFLTQLMNCGALDPKVRKEAAAALMPYVHKKLGETGKKEARQQAAEDAAKGGSRFGPGRPPLKAVN